MKIRAGFVSNSSSTSFLLIAKEDLNREDFLELVGVSLDSPINDLFGRLFESILDAAHNTFDFGSSSGDIPLEKWFNDTGTGISERMLSKMKEAKEKGLKVYYGHLDTESDQIQTFFCTDSFEAENEKIYLNALQCVW